MRWFVILLVLSLVLSGCIHGKQPLAVAFETMELISGEFVDASVILNDLHLAGLISDARWTEKVIPAHDKGKLAIDAAWIGLHAWSVAGEDNAARVQFQSLLSDAVRLTADLKAFTEVR